MGLDESQTTIKKMTMYIFCIVGFNWEHMCQAIWFDIQITRAAPEAAEAQPGQNLSPSPHYHYYYEPRGNYFLLHSR